MAYLDNLWTRKGGIFLYKCDIWGLWEDQEKGELYFSADSVIKCKQRNTVSEYLEEQKRMKQAIHSTLGNHFVTQNQWTNLKKDIDNGSPSIYNALMWTPRKFQVANLCCLAKHGFQRNDSRLLVFLTGDFCHTRVFWSIVKGLGKNPLSEFPHVGRAKVCKWVMAAKTGNPRSTKGCFSETVRYGLVRWKF